jgi:hypothetical protein
VDYSSALNAANQFCGNCLEISLNVSRLLKKLEEYRKFICGVISMAGFEFELRLCSAAYLEYLITCQTLLSPVLGPFLTALCSTRAVFSTLVLMKTSIAVRSSNKSGTMLNCPTNPTVEAIPRRQLNS